MQHSGFHAVQLPRRMWACPAMTCSCLALLGCSLCLGVLLHQLSPLGFSCSLQGPDCHSHGSRLWQCKGLSACRACQKQAPWTVLSSGRHCYCDVVTVDQGRIVPDLVVCSFKGVLLGGNLIVCKAITQLAEQVDAGSLSSIR